MTDEELAKKYYEAAENALLYGTGFIKVVMVDNKFVATVVDPKDYGRLTASLQKQESSNG